MTTAAVAPAVLTSGGTGVPAGPVTRMGVALGARVTTSVGVAVALGVGASVAVCIGTTTT
jgi:hypothetical protein